jgi:hypothetical protein
LRPTSIQNLTLLHRGGKELRRRVALLSWSNKDFRRAAARTS